MLDTTAYVGFKRNNVETVEFILQAEQILFSPVVLGELMFGFRNGILHTVAVSGITQFIGSELEKFP